MKLNNLFYSLLLLICSVLCSPAPTVNFSSPPFSSDFIVDQPHNFIALRGSSNTVPIGVFPIVVAFQTGTNYFSISTSGALTGYVLTVTNGVATWLPNSGGGGSGGSGATNLTGDVTGTISGGTIPTTVVKINGTSLAGLGTGILKNTTVTGVPSIAVAGDFPTLNQNTTGNAVTANSALTALSATSASALRSSTTTIVVSGATAPTAGQTLTAISGTAANWQTPSASGGGTLTNTAFTNSGPDTVTIGPTSYINTNGFGGGGGSGIPTFNGSGTNTTLVSSSGVVQFTNYTSGNGVSFDGTSLLLDGINLNTGAGGSIGGNGAGLISLNASGIASGTVPLANLPTIPSTKVSLGLTNVSGDFLVFAGINSVTCTGSSLQTVTLGNASSFADGAMVTVWSDGSSSSVVVTNYNGSQAVTVPGIGQGLAAYLGSNASPTNAYTFMVHNGHW